MCIFALHKTECHDKAKLTHPNDFEITTLIANALLNRQMIRKQNWVEYDCLTEQLLETTTDRLMEMTPEDKKDRYKDDLNAFGKTELAAMTLLKIADEMPEDKVVDKSRLQQNGLQLLDYVQMHGDTFSLQRAAIITLLKDL